jgi:hypothetical protein
MLNDKIEKNINLKKREKTKKIRENLLNLFKGLKFITH